MTRIADRLLARLAPKVEARAGCTYQWYSCACIYRVGRYQKKCMYGCSGVPDHCYDCVRTGPC
jgi:hypothetical protein